MQTNEKLCPKCAEVVKKAAVVCKHCGHQFSLLDIRKEQRKVFEDKTDAKIGCGCVVAGALVIVTIAVIGSAIQRLPGGEGSSQQKSPTEPEIRREFQVQSMRLMSDTLKDSGSAKYRNVHAYKHTSGNYVFCGEVNSKNSYGGYSGFRRFMANPKLAVIEGEVKRSEFKKSWAEFCAVALDAGEVGF